MYRKPLARVKNFIVPLRRISEKKGLHEVPTVKTLLRNEKRLFVKRLHFYPAAPADYGFARTSQVVARFVFFYSPPACRWQSPVCFFAAKLEINEDDTRIYQYSDPALSCVEKAVWHDILVAFRVCGARRAERGK